MIAALIVAALASGALFLGVALARAAALGDRQWLTAYSVLRDEQD